VLGGVRGASIFMSERKPVLDLVSRLHEEIGKCFENTRPLTVQEAMVGAFKLLSNARG
jgi:hypothetical protein